MYIMGRILFYSAIVVVLLRLFNLSTFPMWQIPAVAVLATVFTALCFSLIYGLEVFIRLVSADELEKQQGTRMDVVLGTFYPSDNVTLVHTIGGKDRYLYFENGRDVTHRVRP